MNNKQPPVKNSPKGQTDKRAQALKANLAKRKEQQRERQKTD